VHDVVHYCVTNMPGAVPRTSTIGLSNATLPYGLVLADHGLLGAIAKEPALAKGVNVLNGKLTHPAVAAALGLEYTPVSEAALAGMATLPA
jgi:alanine dehydrogenase